MRIKNPWLRRIAMVGVILAGIALFLFTICWVILSRKPLTGSILKEPATLKLLMADQSPDQKQSGEKQLSIDPQNPPSSYEAYVQENLKHSPNDGSILYLEMLREFKEKHLWEERERISQQSYGTFSIEDPMPKDYLIWLDSQKDFIDRINAMIQAGGPPVLSANDLLSIERETFGNQEEYRFWIFANHVLFEQTLHCVQADNPDEAVRRAVDFIHFLCFRQRTAEYVPNVIGMAYFSRLCETLAPVLERSRMMPSRALALNHALSKLKTFALGTGEAMDFLYRLRRDKYVAVINGAPIDAIEKVDQMEISSLSFLMGGYEPNSNKHLEFIHIRYRATQLYTICFWDALKVKIHGENTLNALDARWQQMIAQCLEAGRPEAPNPNRSSSSNYLLSTEMGMTDLFGDRYNQIRDTTAKLALLHAALYELSGEKGANPMADPFSGGALKRREDGDFLELWSVSENKKDDGGPWIKTETNDDIGLRVRIKQEGTTGILVP